jgi:hypothetical protein
VRKQVLLLSILVLGLIIFAPFRGGPRFRLTPSSGMGDFAATGHAGEIGRILPSPVQSFLQIDAESHSPPLEAEYTANQNPFSHPVEVKQTASSQLSLLSSQDYGQQLTHPCIQDGFLQHEMLDMVIASTCGTSSIRSNREPILVSHDGEYSGSPGTPRYLPPAEGNEWGWHGNPEPITRILLHPECFTPEHVDDIRPSPPAPYPGINSSHPTLSR